VGHKPLKRDLAYFVTPSENVLKMFYAKTFAKMLQNIFA